MSRTYRCRHMPKKKAAKIIDGHGSARWRRHWKAAEEKATSLLGYGSPEQHMVLAKGGTHRAYVPPVFKTTSFFGSPCKILVSEARYETRPGRWAYTKEYLAHRTLQDRIAEGTIQPVSSWHPYQKHPSVKSSRKKYYRTKANRVFRRKVKATLDKYDPDESLWPDEREVFNWWDVY